MVKLVRMTEPEFDAFLEQVIPTYAEEHVRAGNWHASEALARSEKEIRGLLPDGARTENHFLFMIVDEASGSAVGRIWYGIDDKRPEPAAFIYDFMIFEGFRRKGYATEALRLVEEQARTGGATSISLHVFGHNHAARRLYEKIGFEEVGILMSKKTA